MFDFITKTIYYVVSIILLTALCPNKNRKKDKADEQRYNRVVFSNKT